MATGGRICPVDMERQLTRTVTWHTEGVRVRQLACCSVSNPKAVRRLATSPRGVRLRVHPFGLRGALHWEPAKGQKRPSRRSPCQASLSDDLPLILIIGASVLYSAAPLLLPLQESPKPVREEDLGLFGKGNVRYAAMGIISFIPLFDWLAWVFAYLDTSEQRYLVFAAIYAAPYIRTGFSLSPEDSWLPLLSVLICIAHVQIDSLAKSETPPEPLLKDLPRLKLPDLPSPRFSEWREKFEAKLEELEAPLREAERKEEEQRAAQRRQEEEEREAARRREEEAKEAFRRWDEKLAQTQNKNNETPPHNPDAATKHKD